MTDLTEMVDWLRGVVSGDLKRAEAATPGPWQSTVHRDTGESAICAGEPFNLGATIAWVGHPDSVHIATHDPNDTIARCEQELEIIGRARFLGDRAERAGNLASSTVITDGRYRVLEDVVRLLAYGYRNRMGWKAEWKP